MEKESYRILVVDDDVRLRDLLKRYLGEQGFNVKTVSDAAQMDRALLREHFDLMVLDLMLPGEDGLAICRRLRGTENTIPIVMLTAKGDDVDRIVGLEMGADDYLPKPFNPRELVARIHAVLRRQPQTPPGAPATEDEDVSFGSVVVQLGTRILVRNGEETLLTTGEFALLKVLLQHPDMFADHLARDPEGIGSGRERSGLSDLCEDLHAREAIHQFPTNSFKCPYHTPIYLDA